MAQIEIIVRGYAKKTKNGWHATSTCTLIQENNVKMLVDPGMDRKALLNGLKKFKLKTSDIHYVILTHYHLDHSLLAGIFENAKVMDNTEAYSWDGKMKKHNGEISKTKVRIIKTPGHDNFHCSVIAKTKEYGTVAVAGDVFWWQDDEKQEETSETLLKHKDPYIKDKTALKKSRNLLLETADIIIPGHGKPFRKIRLE
jgi:glyoxylase-like metal-dependent hydrolase (beta-lactamase superfamily II)